MHLYINKGGGGQWTGYKQAHKEIKYINGGFQVQPRNGYFNKYI